MSLIFLGIINGQAKTFKSEKIDDYKFKLSWIESNTTNTKTKSIYLVTNENNQAYYNVEPNLTYFERKEYQNNDLLLDIDTFKEIAKYIYYGYGYQNHYTEEYYVATQYLVFKALNIDEVEIIDKNNNPCDYAKNEIESIKKLIKENSIKILNIKTQENFI